MAGEERNLIPKVQIKDVKKIYEGRNGQTVALTTLIAAESTGAEAGLGMRIRSFSNSFEVAPMLLYIILIGIIGITSEKLIKTLERKLTGWQEKREV